MNDILKGIKNIIFDLGGVIINIDYNITIEKFKLLGIKNFDNLYTQLRQDPWFDLYDKGGISSDQFVSIIKKYLPSDVSPEQIIDAWNAMLLDFPPERADLLRKLKTKYRTFILSNTNELHIDYYFSLLEKWYGISDMSPFFEKQYYSYLMGKRKPDAEIFEFVLQDSRLNPRETLFIDDSIQNVNAAAGCKIVAYHLQPPETIMDIFSDHTG